MDWSKFWIFLVDERNVKEGDKDSNFGEIDKAFSSKVITNNFLNVPLTKFVLLNTF